MYILYILYRGSGQLIYILTVYIIYIAGRQGTELQTGCSQSGSGAGSGADRGVSGYILIYIFTLRSFYQESLPKAFYRAE